jgi:hypothetical protein
MTFTPSQNAVCQVNTDLAINGGSIQYGIGEYTAASENQSVDETGVMMTTNGARSRLVNVTAGTTYTFEIWVQSSGTGTAFFDEDYICYGV